MTRGKNFTQFSSFYQDDSTNFIVAKDNTIDLIRLVNNAFAYAIHDARISTSSGVVIEQNKFVGPVSTMKRLVTQKDGDLSHILI